MDRTMKGLVEIRRLFTKKDRQQQGTSNKILNQHIECFATANKSSEITGSQYINIRPSIQIV